MILETIKDQEYHKKILLANDSYAEIERKEGTQLIINVDYKGVYGLGEKFDAVNQKGKTVETQVIEKFCNQGNISYCVTPFFVTDSGLGIYIETKKKTTKFWFQKRKYLSDIGVDGFKTDGGEFIYSEEVNFSDGTNGAEGKNQYCQDYVNAYSNEISEEQVLFSRAGYAGASGTPILWAGDHQSTNDELKNVLRAALSAAMSGILFWSFDIGGFAGPLPSIDLYRRSTQMAVFSPIMQWHSEPDGGQFRELMPGSDGNNERSPWNVALAYGQPEFIDEMRYWHTLREELLPYIYQTAKIAVRESKPMMRPLVYDFQEDSNVINLEDEYLFGNSMLVAPLMEENQTSRKVYLPKGQWFDFFTNKCYEGEKWIDSDPETKLPVYVKSGTTIQMEQDGKNKIFLYGKEGKDSILSDQIDITWKGKNITVKGETEQNIIFDFIQ